MDALLAELPCMQYRPIDELEHLFVFLLGALPGSSCEAIV